MAENRRRFRNKKREDVRAGPSALTPVTIAKREDVRTTLTPLQQPKILLKKELESNNGGSSSSGSTVELPSSIKTIIINRSDTQLQQSRISSERTLGYSSSLATTRATPTTITTSTTIPISSSSVTAATVCAALATANNQPCKETTNGSTASSTSGQDIQLVPMRMTRPTPLILANGVYNTNARKLFHKSNTDFTVIGVLGTQSVGKSTLLNLLSAENGSDYDHYQHLFAANADACIFPIKHRPKSQQQATSTAAATAKSVLRPTTDTLQFFITRQRYVLLDTAPMLAGGTVKEADHLELQTLATIMQLLTVCHVLLLAIDEINLDQLRLIHDALRLRPHTPCKGYVRDYMPQVIFVRTHAQRQHYEPVNRERLDRQLELLYAGTNLPIYRGRGDARKINTLLLPHLSSNSATTHHPNVTELVRQFRERVFSTVRLPMCHSNDFSEVQWFDMLAETISKCIAGSQHFEKIYAEIKLRHLEIRSKLRSDDNWRSES